MRLENDGTRRSASPARAYSNGSSTRSPRLNKIANGNSHAKSDSNGSAASYTNGSGMNAVRQRSESFYGHDREEVTRILIQSLSDLGYHGAANALIQESGFELEGPTVADFRKALLSGEWAKAEALLFGSDGDEGGGGRDSMDNVLAFSKRQGKTAKNSWSPQRPIKGLTLSVDANKDEMRFWMRQQKYLELLEGRDLGAALRVLQQELTPLHQDVTRLHALSSLMMCKSAEDLKSQARWDGAAGESRHILLTELSKSISPSVMIPEHRLAVLLDHVKNSWIAGCLYHNTRDSPSLYVDHECDPKDFPKKTILELRNHTDEVWYLKYSHDGTKLATASSDKTIVIYDTNTYKVIHTLNQHESGVCFLTWSPDDTKLISCSQAPENSARVWDVRTGIILREMSEFTYPVTTATWAPDGETFVTGSQDIDHSLIVWDLMGHKIHQWKEDNLRVHDLAISPDGQRLVVLLAKRIFVYNYITRAKLSDWSMGDAKLTSVAITQDSRYMLVSKNDSKIRLMDIETGQILQTFTGHTQMEFVIRSSFGGAGETFVVSGSEDSRIYIWRTTGHLVESLEAHRGGCVNAVAWHPKDPHVFASAGDDHKVRIWSLDRKEGFRSLSSSNGFGR